MHYFLLIALLCIASSKLQAQTPDLASFPTSHRLWMAIDEGEISAAKQETFTLQSESPVLFLKAHNSALKKEEHWATADEKNLEFERRTLALAEKESTNKLNTANDKRDEVIEKTEESILALLAKRLEFEDSLDNEHLSKSIRKRIGTRISKINAQIKSLKEDISQSALDEQILLETDKLQLTIEKQRRNFMLLEKNSLLKAPFDGVLKLNIENPEKVLLNEEELWLKPNKVFATITDESHYEVTLSNRNPVFQIAAVSSMSLSVGTGFDQDFLTASFLETRRESASPGKIQDFHVFKVAEKSLAKARSSAGEKLPVHIYINFSKPQIIIAKSQIALLAPDILENRGWVGLVQHLYPKVQISAVGPEGIAVYHGN